MLSSNGKLFTSNRYVRGYCVLAESIGFKKQDFAQQIGLSVKSIDDPQVIISKNYIVKAYQLLLDFSDDELLGATRSKLPRGSVELMVKSASVESTLKHALKAIEQVISVSQSDTGSEIIIEQDIVRWRYAPAVNEDRFYSLMATTLLYITKKLISLLIRKELKLTNVNLAEGASDHLSDYQFLFDCPLNFEQKCYEITFDKSWLNEPIRCDFDRVKSYLRVPLSLTSYSTATLGTTEQIKNILAACSYSQFPSQKELAQQMGISIRTMQRKLSEQSICYMQLKDDVRQRKALYYLEHTKKSLDEIAQRCGFSELASFSRAFKRWTGCSPYQYKVT